MVIEVNFVQPEKQLSPKLITDDGIVTDFKPSHQKKHSSPKLVTDDGMVIDFKFLQPLYLLLVDYQYYTL